MRQIVLGITFRFHSFFFLLAFLSYPDYLLIAGCTLDAQCTALTNVYAGNALEIIGRSAFEECTGLQDFAFPAALTTLGERAFYRCAALRSVTLPENATDLGYGAFAYCTSLLQNYAFFPKKLLINC